MSRRSSLSPPPSSIDSPHDLKQRVITCLNKLSDRDTLAVATAELELIARNLTRDLFSPFLTCIQATDSSVKSPVRKQCVRLLQVMSATHGDDLSPHLAKMISTVVRRLRDSDSSVRTACVDTVAVMSSQITKSPFASFVKSFMDVILTEQDHNSQIGSALCLAAAIEASPESEPALLVKILPRLLKLVRSEGFKAKPALLKLIGSVVASGGGSSRGALDCLVPCLIELLSSEDWAVRKAAAEVLGKVALLDRDLVVEYKKTCLCSLDSRRFDKVKGVRDTMNSTLDSWKNVSDGFEVSLSHSKSSSRDGGNNEGCSPTVSKISPNIATETTEVNKPFPGRSPASNNSLLTNTAKKKSLIKIGDRISYSAMSRKLDYSPDSKTEVDVPQSLSEMISEDNVKREYKVSEVTENEKTSKLETKNVLCDEKLHRFGHVKYGSRVVPIHMDENSDLGTDDLYVDNRDIEDLNLIRKQLVQIENQQSNLLDILKRFIGSSENGMNTLETRVQGLEMALNEISYDLALSTGSISSLDSTRNTCCKLPGADFLTPKFWRRTEGRYSTPRYPYSGGIGLLNPIRNRPHIDAMADTYNLDKQRFPQQNGIDTRHNLKFSKRTLKDMNLGTEKVHACYAGELDASSIGSCGTSVKLSKRLSA